jgi:RNA polymerase sigma factor (sigma-70 family)
MGAKLTDREREVMRLLKQRLTTKQIAARLGLSPVTVRRHISSSVRKLEAGNRAAAVRRVGGLHEIERQ